MKLTTGLAALFLAIFLSFALQEMIPPVSYFDGARILIVPLLFCYGAIVFPGWAMVLLAIFTGLCTDLMNLHVVGGQVEIALGWSIVYFVVLGALAQGFQPAFQRGHWWIYVLLSAVGTSAFLAAQFVMISLRREPFVFNEIILWRILGPGLFAAILAPLLHLIAVGFSQFYPDAPEMAKPYRARR